VQSYLETYGISRFAGTGVINERRTIHEFYGYKRWYDGTPQYLVYASAFKGKLHKGFSHRFALDVLKKCGALIKAGNGDPYQQTRPEGFKTDSRFYVIDAEKIGVPFSTSTDYAAPAESGPEGAAAYRQAVQPIRTFAYREPTRVAARKNQRRK